jgi:choline/glycine/proline betaine transport protein
MNNDPHLLLLFFPLSPSQFFIIFVAYRFGNIRLGPKDARPEFTDYEYFAMLFSAGIGVGVRFINNICVFY